MYTSGFVHDVVFVVWRVAKRAYSQSNSPEGRTGGDVMMPTIALFFRVILRLNVFVLPKFVLFLNKCSAVYS